MNRTLIVTAFLGLGAIAIGGAVAIHLINPQAEATFSNFIFTLLGLMTTAAVTIGGLSKVNEKVEQVRAQTNGTLTAKEQKIADLERRLLDNGIDPQTGAPVTGATDTLPA